MPGYVLVKMDMSEEVYHAIKDQPRVGISRAHGKPTPLPDAEVARILIKSKRVETNQDL